MSLMRSENGEFMGWPVGRSPGFAPDACRSPSHLAPPPIDRFRSVENSEGTMPIICSPRKHYNGPEVQHWHSHEVHRRDGVPVISEECHIASSTYDCAEPCSSKCNTLRLKRLKRPARSISSVIKIGVQRLHKPFTLIRDLRSYISMLTSSR